MDLADAIGRTEGHVVFYGHDGREVEAGDYLSARHCRIQAGRCAARVLSLCIGCYELWYDATGRYLGRSIIFALAA